MTEHCEQSADGHAQINVVQYSDIPPAQAQGSGDKHRIRIVTRCPAQATRRAGSTGRDVTQAHVTVGECIQRSSVVSRDNQSQVVTRGEVGEQSRDVASSFPMQSGERFVNEDELHIADQCSREGHSALLPPGEFTGPSVQEIGRQTHGVESPGAVQRGARRSHFKKQGPHGENRIECGPRILSDEGHPMTT
ncbi:hypothetical protein A8M60_19275 [Nocardia farcinica]|nr:hypothetical protein A8M60_19275 [Nocardia farcinica]